MPAPAPPVTFNDRLVAVADAIESTLDGLLSATALPGEITRPARLLEAMRYSTLGGGKRLRPFLVVETARVFGVEGVGPLRAGAAVEMIHCYSLIHDDLPAMDDDDLRRGRPTAHRAFDEATAILSGDALLTYAFDTLAGEDTHPDPAVPPGARARPCPGLGHRRHGRRGKHSTLTQSASRNRTNRPRFCRCSQ